MNFRALVCLPLALAFSCQVREKDPGVNDELDMSIAPQDIPFMECAASTYEANQAPAALLVVLDRSSSMAENNKWLFAARAIVQALDQDVFDSMHLGLYAAPSGNQAGPACIFNLPVACQAPPFPQVDLALGGVDRSPAAAGVRRKIKDWLTVNSPDDGVGDASPMYLALQASIASLRDWPVDGKRILFVVTDGTLSCAQFSTRPGFADCNGCDHDWENPQNLIDLLATANKDPKKPIETFIVGVPGADTYDPRGCNYPPYRMRMALSAIAAAGAPAYVPKTCTGKTFAKDGMDPAVACHFDLTRGFDGQAIADAIAGVRGQVLGCTYELPKPTGGETVDRDRVNVSYTTGGGKTSLPRRKDRTNPCDQNGCWDYSPEGKIGLLGKACGEVKMTPNIKVQISVGCATIFG